MTLNTVQYTDKYISGMSGGAVRQQFISLLPQSVLVSRNRCVPVQVCECELPSSQLLIVSRLNVVVVVVNISHKDNIFSLPEMVDWTQKGGDSCALCPLTCMNAKKLVKQSTVNEWGVKRTA